MKIKGYVFSTFIGLFGLMLINQSNRFVALDFSNFSLNKLEGVFFDKVELGDEVKGQFTSLVVGPDQKLYAASIDGVIKRFHILEDGTLKLDVIFRPFGTTKRLLIGLRFDLEANARHLKAWITYSDHHELTNGPAFDGRLARILLSSTNNKVLENTLVITNLPRSGSDHLTNSIDFGSDGALYISQGSYTSMGRADNEKIWLGREETILAGAILRLDLQKLPKKLPIDVKTLEGGGKYNPLDKDTPLTIFATGIRNAYDLVWHSNGQLYVPTNGSREGNNTPTSDPKHPEYIPPHPGYTNTEKQKVPAIDFVNPAQKDYLFRVEKGGFYGHPNPRRAEYVLNHGGADVDHPTYQNIKPDKNYRGESYDFGHHVSPNGVIEYKSNAFGGKLKGFLLVARLTKYSDIVALKIGGDKKDIVNAYDGLFFGMAQLSSPLDLTEDTKTGNIYVAEYGGDGRILLFKPSLDIEKSKDLMAKQSNKKNFKANFDENKLTALTDEGNIESGKSIYLANCTPCHGQLAEGSVGPNLTDDHWVYGGKIEDIYKVIKLGTKNGMNAWKDQLTPEEIRQVSSYIIRLQGSNPPNAKEPQGTKTLLAN
jgi:glucose/arabinose dehydrogenase/mono/diheme cytochrome c family protein